MLSQLSCTDKLAIQLSSIGFILPLEDVHYMQLHVDTILQLHVDTILRMRAIIGGNEKQTETKHVVLM